MGSIALARLGSSSESQPCSFRIDGTQPEVWLARAERLKPSRSVRPRGDGRGAIGELGEQVPEAIAFGVEVAAAR